MATPEFNLLNLLMNENNISGVWAVIGSLTAASITLFGIFISNFFENKRKRKERQRTIIFDSYVGAMQFIAISNLQIAKAGAGQIDDISNINSSVAEKSYILSLVASPKVVNSFLELTTIYSAAFFSLAAKAIDLKIISSEIEIESDLMQKASNQIEQVLADMKEYNSSEKNSPDLYKIYQEQFDFYCNDRDAHFSKIESLRKKDAEIRLELLKQSTSSTIGISEKNFDLILLMRNDIERKMGRKEFAEVKKSFDLMQSKLNLNSEQFLKDINYKMEKMMEDE